MKNIILCLASIFFLVGCNPSDQSTIPGLEGINDVNHSITLQDPLVLDVDNMLSLAINNHSSNAIWFPPNFNIRLFILEENTWVEIYDSLIPSGDLTVYPADEGGIGLLVFKPSIPIEEISLLRVVIVGNIIETGKPTLSLVGAFLDIPLPP
jgi:hypothetical protein